MPCQNPGPNERYEIPLSRGQVAVVDCKELYDHLIKWKWYASSNGRKKELAYASRSASMQEEVMRFLGREIPPDQVVDHLDHNGLNNSSNNLVVKSKSENNHNRRKHGRFGKPPSSKFRGVSYIRTLYRGRPLPKPWHWSVRKQGVQIQGTTATESAAACAYNKAVGTLYGEHAILNEVTEPCPQES